MFSLVCCALIMHPISGVSDWICPLFGTFCTNGFWIFELLTIILVKVSSQSCRQEIASEGNESIFWYFWPRLDPLQTMLSLFYFFGMKIRVNTKKAPCEPSFTHCIEEKSYLAKQFNQLCYLHCKSQDIHWFMMIFLLGRLRTWTENCDQIKFICMLRACNRDRSMIILSSKTNACELKGSENISASHFNDGYQWNQ